jgi:hypothetical protein
VDCDTCQLKCTLVQRKYEMFFRKFNLTSVGPLSPPSEILLKPARTKQPPQPTSVYSVHYGPKEGKSCQLDRWTPMVSRNRDRRDEAVHLPAISTQVRLAKVGPVFGAGVEDRYPYAFKQTVCLLASSRYLPSAPNGGLLPGMQTSRLTQESSATKYS